MKSRHIISMLLLMMASYLWLPACSDKLSISTARFDRIEMGAEPKAASTEYVCPMHPHIHKRKEGTCPICKMDLVEKDQPEEVDQAVNGHTYVCPMHPHIHKEEKGACPICKMDLVVNQESDFSGHGHHKDVFPTVRVNDITSQIMGITTEKVIKTALQSTSEAIGIVTYNDDTTYELEPRSKGWVDKLHIKTEGTKVRKGTKLLEFYSPEIVSAQDGYILALKANYALPKERQGYLNQLAREKLGLYGIPPKIVKDITENGNYHQTIPLLSPQAGTVTRINVEKDDYVTGADVFMVIADLRSVWVEFDLFEYQIANLKSGDSITVSSLSAPGKVWKGKIHFIYPEASKQTNTIKVRALVKTPKEDLRPNTRVTVRLISKETVHPVLAVPSRAIIPSGSEARVVVRVSDNKFLPKKVKIGKESDHLTEILSGLDEGEEVVTTGQFLLDSESSLQRSFAGADG